MSRLYFVMVLLVAISSLCFAKSFSNGVTLLPSKELQKMPPVCKRFLESFGKENNKQAILSLYTKAFTLELDRKHEKAMVISECALLLNGKKTWALDAERIKHIIN